MLHATGEWDFLLKIVTRNIKAREAFSTSTISRGSRACDPGEFSVAVTVIKESTALPLNV